MRSARHSKAPMLTVGNQNATHRHQPVSPDHAVAPHAAAGQPVRRRPGQGWRGRSRPAAVRVAAALGRPPPFTWGSRTMHPALTTSGPWPLGGRPWEVTTAQAFFVDLLGVDPTGRPLRAESACLVEAGRPDEDDVPGPR